MDASNVEPGYEIAIRAELARYVEASLAQDWEKFCDAFDADPVCMPPGASALTSRTQIREFYERFPSLDSLVLKTTEFEKAGELVIELGRYQFSSGDLHDRGKYLHVWRRQETGSWKLYRNISNSDGPAAEE